MTNGARWRAWARNAAHALVDSSGGSAVSLRIPAPAGSTAADELGMVATGVSEIALSPVLVRRSDSGASLLVSADVMHHALRVEDASAATKCLRDCEGVSVFGEWMFVREVEAREVAGEPYLYRVELSLAQGEA